MELDHDRCLRAVQARDVRFDGWFVMAVRTTGIYCRPSCPATTPSARNVRFLPGPAAAQEAGYRACRRCRPDASPGSPEWDARADVAARAMRLIADGVVDRAGVAGLAAQLGYSTRQIERLLLAEMGAGPQALARAQRAQAARILIGSTTLPMTEVAFAAGFRSVRSFNEVVRAVFDRTPTQLRQRETRHQATGTGAIDVRLPYRGALHAAPLFGRLRASALAGVEEWRAGSFRRSLRLPSGSGIVALRPGDGHIACRLQLTDLRDLQAAIVRCRRLLDLDADPDAVDEQLRSDLALRPVVDAGPGRRIPRTVDGAELAARVVLGRHAASPAAEVLTRLVAARGAEISDPEGGCTHLFPDPADLRDGVPEVLARVPAAHRAIASLAHLLTTGSLDLGPGADRAQARAVLRTGAGLDAASVEALAMRALGDPDAFAASDPRVREGARRAGLGHTVAALRHDAERWRPWRSYAVQYLMDAPAAARPPEQEQAA